MTLLRQTRRMPLAAKLHGQHVLLTPLRRRDVAHVAAVPDDPAFDLLLRRFTGTSDSTRRWVDDARAGMRRGTEMCWLIRDAVTGELIGSTRYLNVDQTNSRLEVGSTWLVAGARGGAANAESKLLVLGHAFDRLGVRRVHIQADVRNARSRAAIEALGATFEGILRQHIVLADGSSRDTAVYSITRYDWPRCRELIQLRVEQRTRHLVAQPLEAKELPQVDPGFEPVPIPA